MVVFQVNGVSDTDLYVWNPALGSSSRGSRMDRVVDALIALDRPAARAANGR